MNTTGIISEDLRRIISDKFYDAMDINANVSALKGRKICEEVAIQELTNILKTIVEAKPGDLHLGRCLGEFDHCEACSRARGIEMWANNISEKFPTFTNLLKK